MKGIGIVQMKEQLMRMATALPAGYRNYNPGNYYSIGNSGYFWSSTEDNSYTTWIWVLSYNNSGVYRMNLNKQRGFSVRCLRD